MPEYSFEIRNDKSVFYQRIGWLIILGNAAYFLFLALAAPLASVRITAIGLLILLTLLTLLRIYFRRSVYRFGLHPYFFFLLMAWISSGNYWMAAAMLVFDILHHIATRNLRIIVRSGQVTYPSFPVKKFEWKDISNVILRDDLLTIDLKNDHIIQHTVITEGNPVNQKEFNEFCRKALIPATN